MQIFMEHQADQDFFGACAQEFMDAVFPRADSTQRTWTAEDLLEDS